MIQFGLQLKSITKKEREEGNDKDGLAIVVAYGKAFHGHRFVYSTGIKVPRDGFNAAKPGARLKKVLKDVEDAYDSICRDGSALNNGSLKARIDLFRERVVLSGGDGKELHVYDGEKIERRLIPDGVNKSQLVVDVKAEFHNANPNPRRIIEKAISSGASELFGFWQAVLDGKIKTKKGKQLSKNTLKAKRQTMNILLRYQEYANVTLTFENMNMEFFQNFMYWMETVGMEYKDKDGNVHRKPYDINSRAKNIKDIKAILNLARTNRRIKHDEYTGWSVAKEPNEVVALEKDELLRIMELPLSGTHGDVRDAFVLAAFLGPRISDFKSFKEENLKVVRGQLMFEYVQEKTGVICTIPVHKMAQNILDKRGGKFPTMISEQNFRYALKEVCQAAGLNDRIIIKTRDNKPVYAKKWEAITPHSSRRTFATALFYGWFIKKPMPGSYCMLFTGHRSEKSFLLYIDAKSKDINEKALEYFGIQPIMKVS